MRATHRSVTCLAIACVLAAALLLVVSEARSAEAGGVVTDCSNDTQFSNLLAGGGTITFNCGAAPRTILITSQKSINVNTTIDGGGKITLDGQDAIRLFDVGAKLTLRNIVLTRAFFIGDGGAIINRSNGTLILENSVIRNSKVTSGSGGAIISFGPLTITNSLLEGNEAFNGGALFPRFSGAQTTIINSVLRNNHATDTTDGWGGAILAWDGAPVTIEGSDIYSNTARRGGGIYNITNSVLQLTNVTLSGNWADITGGGVYNESSATLTNVTLSGNSATYGGGIYNWTNSVLQLTDVTLSGNSASSTGGGLYNDGTSTLTNVTLSGNSASSTGGGIFQASGSVNVKNSIVANSPSGMNCAGTVVNNGFNFSSDSTCSFGSGRTSVTVMLGPLANNGGPTLTHKPQPGSPAIDNITSGCPPPSTDQRGAKRPFDGDGNGSVRCDVGAVEYGAPVSVVYVPLVTRDFCHGDDTRACATGPLISTHVYQGYPDDNSDYYYLLLPATGNINATVTNFTATGQLVLRNENGDFLKNQQAENGTMSVTRLGLPAGRYYLQVFAEPVCASCGLYSLTATFP